MFEKATVRGSIVAALRFSVVRFVSVVVAAVLLDTAAGSRWHDPCGPWRHIHR